VLGYACILASYHQPLHVAVESDVSVLKWDFDEYRSYLTDFSLEGIMQCKQFNMLSSMHHSSSLTALVCVVEHMVNWYHKPGHSILSISRC
jgi:hypothetical protein